MNWSQLQMGDNQEFVMNDLRKLQLDAQFAMNDDYDDLDKDKSEMDSPNHSEAPQPKSIHKQASCASESSEPDSMVADLKHDDFSISVTRANVVTPQATGSYFSMVSPVSTGYAIFTIETRCRLPMYGSPAKVYEVDRRFSDFEFLL